MCDQKILQAAIESYLEDEEKLFSGLDTGPQIWYKESVENNSSAQQTHHLHQEPTMNAENTANTNANTEPKEGMKEKAQHAVENTKGFLSRTWEKHGKFISFCLGIAVTAGGMAAADAYKNYTEAGATDGSEQA